MSTNGSRIAISGSETPDSGVTFQGFVDIFDADLVLFGRITTGFLEAVAPIVNVVISGDGYTLAMGTVFPTKDSLISGVKVFDLSTDAPAQIGGPIVAGAMGDLPGLRLDMSENGSSLVVGGRNYENGQGQVRLYKIGRAHV